MRTSFIMALDFSKKFLFILSVTPLDSVVYGDDVVNSIPILRNRLFKTKHSVLF